MRENRVKRILNEVRLLQSLRAQAAEARKQLG
jgi:hypothetical protein